MYITELCLGTLAFACVILFLRTNLITAIATSWPNGKIPPTLTAIRANGDDLFCRDLTHPSVVTATNCQVFNYNQRRLSTTHHPLIMAQIVADGGRIPLETWFWEMPVCTRWWTTATVVTSALVQCHVVTPFQLFYSFRAVFVKSQVSLARCSRRSTLTADARRMADYYGSIGVCLLRSSTLARCHSICYFRSIFYSVTRDYLRRRRGGHRHSSPG